MLNNTLSFFKLELSYFLCFLLLLRCSERLASPLFDLGRPLLLSTSGTGGVIAANLECLCIVGMGSSSKEPAASYCSFNIQIVNSLGNAKRRSANAEEEEVNSATACSQGSSLSPHRPHVQLARKMFTTNCDWGFSSSHKGNDFQIKL